MASRGFNGVLFVATMALVAVISFRNLGDEGILTDESATAAWTVGMMETGHWFFPRYGGEVDLRKPPLQFWLTVGSIELFGANETAFRIPSAIAAAGTAVLLWLWGLRIGGPIAAFTAVLLLFTSQKYLFDHGARTNVHESLLVFSTVAALYFWTRGRAVASGVFGAVALMAKHVAALPLFAIVGSWELARSFGRSLFQRPFLVFVALSFGLAGLWLVPAVLFTESFRTELAYDFGGRPFGGRAFSRELYYVVQLRYAFGAWLLAVPLAAFSFWRRRELEELLLLAIWIAIYLVLFTIASAKYPWYVVPAYPAICLLIGAGVSQLAAWTRLDRTPARALAAALLVAAAMAPRVDATFERMNFVRWEHSPLRPFAEWVRTTLPEDVPVFVHPGPYWETFASYEMFDLFKLRDRIVNVADPEELCDRLAGAGNGAFLIVSETTLDRDGCWSSYRHSRRVTRVKDYPYPYDKKRVLAFGLEPPADLFAPAEIAVDAAAGPGLVAGWSASLDADGRRPVDAGHAIVAIPQHGGGSGLLRVEGRVSGQGECAPEVRWNGNEIGVLADGATELRVPAILPGTNLVEIVRACPATEVAISSLVFRADVAHRRGPGHEGGFRVRRVRGASEGAIVEDDAAPWELAYEKPRDAGAGVLFDTEIRLTPGRYDVDAFLRAIGPVEPGTAARLEIRDDEAGLTLAERRIDAIEIASPSYLPVSTAFSTGKKRSIRVRVHVTGSTRVRAGGVELRSHGDLPSADLR